MTQRIFHLQAFCYACCFKLRICGDEEEAISLNAFCRDQSCCQLHRIVSSQIVSDSNTHSFIYDGSTHFDNLVLLFGAMSQKSFTGLIKCELRNVTLTESSSQCGDNLNRCDLSYDDLMMNQLVPQPITSWLISVPFDQ